MLPTISRCQQRAWQSQRRYIPIQGKSGGLALQTNTRPGLRSQSTSGLHGITDMVLRVSDITTFYFHRLPPQISQTCPISHACGLNERLYSWHTSERRQLRRQGQCLLPQQRGQPQVVWQQQHRQPLHLSQTSKRYRVSK